ncbi:MAG: molybdenum cofactor guanylyltransferase [Porticoccaceae bacterium]
MSTFSPKPKTIGAILAGGRSRRMGQDKALLQVGSGTLLDHMNNKLKALPILADVLICRNQQGYLNDIKPDLGPLGALYTLSQNYPDYRALIVPVDMPLLSTELLAKLCEKSAGTSAIHFEDYVFPLVIHMGKELNQELEKRIKNSDSDLSVAKLLRDIKTETTPKPVDMAQLSNINTLDEWEALQQKLR